MWQRLRRIGWGILGCPDPRLPLGARGEWCAARHLSRKGFSVIERALRNRFGEIDLIAIEPGSLKRIVFVEVKTSTIKHDDHPAERVDKDKQTRVTRAALYYLKSNQLLEHPCRFDVIAVWWQTGSWYPHRLEHYEHAFEATGHHSFFS